MPKREACEENFCNMSANNPGLALNHKAYFVLSNTSFSFSVHRYLKSNTIHLTLSSPGTTIGLTAYLLSSLGESKTKSLFPTLFFPNGTSKTYPPTNLE